MHLIHRLTYFLILLVGSFSFAAAKESKDLMKANYYYSNYRYFKAIPYFEKVAGQMNDAAIYSRLADCYSIVNDQQKAAEAYAKAVNIPGCSQAIVLRYAQVLMQLERYDEAIKWLGTYHEHYKDDRRTSNLISGCERFSHSSNAGNQSDIIPDGIATLLPFNTDGSDFGPTLWNGVLVFASDTAIDMKKRTDTWTGRAYYNIFALGGDDAGAKRMVKMTTSKGVNIKYHDGPCTFSADGKKMYFTRSRVKQNVFGNKSISNKDSVVVLEIMIASDYDTAARKFRTIEPFEHNNEAYAVQHPTVSPNGKVMAFSSNMPKGFGGSDIYWCKKSGSGWGAPQNIGSIINTEGEEVFPYWADDNTLFFSSDGHAGMGGLDIYKTRWDDHTNTFTAPENAGLPINSSYDDISLAMNADERGTYFSSNRPAAKGSDNIYLYAKKKVYLLLTVLDSLTGQPITGATANLGSTMPQTDGRTDNNGNYVSRLHPETTYSGLVHKDEYPDARFGFTATGNKPVDTIFKTIRLYKPAPRERDTIPPLVAKARKKNVMDTPGIREFELGEVYELGHFHYEYDKYKLNAEQKLILDTLMAQLTRHPTLEIEIIAHTDCRGTMEYNLELSKNRALSVVTYLVEHRISKKRLKYKGVGFTEPTVPCPDCQSCTEEQHVQNRLLEFKVLKL